MRAEQSETSVIKQLSFIDRPQIRLNEGVELGANATDVFFGILDENPDITAVAYRFFDSFFSSDDHEVSDPDHIWADRSAVTPDSLKALSAAAFEESKLTIPVNTGDGEPEEVLTVGHLLAMTSMVRLDNGEIRHIPMLDFHESVTKDPSVIPEIVWPEPGVIVQTDNSYHFWGYNLMTEDQWRTFMVRLEEIENTLSSPDEIIFFGDIFFPASLNRGFTALRLFGYPGTERPTNPRVVGYI